MAEFEMLITRRRSLATLGAWAALAAAPGGSRAASAGQLPTSRAVPGGVVTVPLGPAPELPRALLAGAAVLVMGEPSQWTAVVGLGLSVKPGTLTLRVEAAGQPPRSESIQVAPATYAVQRLKVPQRQVDLSAEDLARYQRERQHLNRVMATRSPRIPGSLRMRVPVPGPRSSSFGLRRIFNGQARSPHGGMDIAAPAGTPVACPLEGQVIDVGDYFFTGRCVWLDHGSGALSFYAHLDTVAVENGRELQAGELLGTVGATGRVTGAHLHWSVMLNRAYVDPALFIDA
jgi:murein DD-endopeptidase MepM/ murein hydrolase activator NlpD